MHNLSNVTNYPWIAEGEILGVQEPEKGDAFVVRYYVNVRMRDGRWTNFTDVEDFSVFGGIGDYQRRRARTRSDAEYNNSVSVADRDASVGERVYVAFINGNLLRPVIIGYQQHPIQVKEDNLDVKDPDIFYVSQYQGLREEIDKTGRYRITRKGAPVVKYAPQDGGLLEGAPSLPGATDSFAGDDSQSLEPAGLEERVVMEWLEKGLFRIRDPGGNVFEMDHSGRTGIYISDNDWRSDEDPDTAAAPESGGQQFGANSTKAEYLWLAPDKGLAILNAREIIQLYSFGRRKDVTEGNHSHKIFDNSEYRIGGDKIVEVKGDREDSTENDYDIFVGNDFTHDVGHDYSITVAGSMDKLVKSDYDITVEGSFTLFTAGNQELKTDSDYVLEASGGAKLVLSKGKVALGAGATEVVDSIIQALDAFTKAAPTLVSTAVGPGVMDPGLAATIIQLSTALKLIKGNL